MLVYFTDVTVTPVDPGQAVRIVLLVSGEGIAYRALNVTMGPVAMKVCTILRQKGLKSAGLAPSVASTLTYLNIYIC